MKSILIDCKLNKHVRYYTGLIDKINGSFTTRLHYSDSTWIVKTDFPCVQVRNMLEPFVNSGDKLLIVEISGVGAWHGLNGYTSQWLQDNL